MVVIWDIWKRTNIIKVSDSDDRSAIGGPALYYKEPIRFSEKT